MKKTLFLGILFSLAIQFLSAQQPTQITEGRVRYLVTHSWAKKIEAVWYLSKQRKEKTSYMNNGYEWKEYKEMFFDASHTKYVDSDENPNPSNSNYSWKKEPMLYYRDYKENKQIDMFNAAGKTYLVEDAIVKPIWKIGNDIKEVAGHVCMNAFTQDTIKKHRITAWFAMDIPLNYGPADFNGLPGMILELDYNDGAMTIVADKIETKPVTTELALPKKLKGKKVTQQRINEVTTEIIKEKIVSEEPWFWVLNY